MLTGFARVVVFFLVATGLCACGEGGEVAGSRPSGSIRYYAVGQNGADSSPWGDGSAFQRPAMAVKFTPRSYPVTITSVTIYATNNTGSDQAFNLHGFNNLSTEARIFDPVMNQSLPVTGTSSTARTVNIPATTISSGSFYVAVEWVTKPLTSVSGANSFFLRTDSQLDLANTNFIRYSGTTWSTLESKNAAAGDLGIFVNYGSNPTNDKPVVVSAVPSKGAIGVNRNIQEIEITFSKEMAQGLSVGGGVNWPLSIGTPARWSADRRTLYISRDNATALLPAGSQFQIELNPPGHTRNFMDIFSNTLDRYSLTFTTGQ